MLPTVPLVTPEEWLDSCSNEAEQEYPSETKEFKAGYIDACMDAHTK
jgi:hypothetical protein